MQHIKVKRRGLEVRGVVNCNANTQHFPPCVKRPAYTSVIDQVSGFYYIRLPVHTYLIIIYKTFKSDQGPIS